MTRKKSPLADLLAQYDPSAPYAGEVWADAQPVGREFGAPLKPLHTEDDYRAALAEVSALVDLDPEAGTPEGDRLDILSTLVERYETAHFPFGAAVRDTDKS